VTLYVGYRFLERTRVTSPGSPERT